MSAPNTNTEILFSDRVELAVEGIAKRLTDINDPKQKTALQARLWCRWLKREVSA